MERLSLKRRHLQESLGPGMREDGISMPKPKSMLMVMGPWVGEGRLRYRSGRQKVLHFPQFLRDNAGFDALCAGNSSAPRQIWRPSPFTLGPADAQSLHGTECLRYPGA